MNFSQLSFGLFKLQFYGLFAALAFGLGVWFFYKAAVKKQLEVDIFTHAFWHWLLIGLGVGRVFTIMSTPSLITEYGVWGIFAFWEGGVFFPAVVTGFLISAFLELKVHQKESIFWQWIDVAAIPFCMALWILDLGGFLTGAIYGVSAEFRGSFLPWGVQYETFGVDVLTPVHPVTLYAFFAHIWWVWRIQKKAETLRKVVGKRGMLTLLFVLLVDFLLSFIRYSDNLPYIGSLRFDQWFGVVALLFVGYVCIRKYSRFSTLK